LDIFLPSERSPRNEKPSIADENMTTKDKESVADELEDEALREVDKRKKARLRTRGPYRQANLKTQREK
jgi:hypothetical protein